MFDSLKKLLKSPTATSAEIRAEIEEIEGALPNSQRQLDDLKTKRQAVLLSGSEKERSAIRAEIMRAEDEVDALNAAMGALRTKLEEALAEERRSGLLARVEASQKASDRGVKLVERYLELAAEMTEVLAELQTQDAAVRVSWDASHELAVEKVQTPFRRAAKSEQYTEFVGMVALPMLDGVRRFFWPPSDPDRKAELEALQRKVRAAA